MNILTTIDTDMKGSRFRKKTKKIATAKKSDATAHCTHLPLLAETQANPKAKSKECNRQLFKTLRKIKIETFVKTPL